MRKYELTFIVRPDLSEDNLNAAIEQVQQWVTAEGGNEVERVDQWGRRRLAYHIGDHREGYYVLLEVNLDADTINEIERNLKLSDNILRYLLIRMEK
jgi:small subunit ribosomal protein S6